MYKMQGSSLLGAWLHVLCLGILTFGQACNRGPLSPFCFLCLWRSCLFCTLPMEAFFNASCGPGAHFWHSWTSFCCHFGALGLIFDALGAHWGSFLAPWDHKDSKLRARRTQMSPKGPNSPKGNASRTPKRHKQIYQSREKSSLKPACEKT